MKFKKNVNCEVCKKAIEMPKARIEYNKTGFMHVCHKECSYGRTIPRMIISDFDLDAEWGNADTVMEHFAMINKLFPACRNRCKKIISEILE